MEWLLTCFAAGEAYEEEMSNMVASFQTHHPYVHALTGTFAKGAREWHEISNFKMKWLCWIREAYPSPSILWVDADARFRRAIKLPADSDVAAKCYGAYSRTETTRISTGTLLLGPKADLEFLRAWRDMPFDDIPSNECTLGKALTLHPSLRYVELSDALTSVCNLSGWNGKLEHDSAIVHWNRSRKELGAVEDWPPSEEERSRV